jgi:hypothetical protein
MTNDFDEVDYSMELSSIATAIKYLGTGDAATRMGAIEALCVEVGRVADGLFDIASAIRESQQ